MKLLQVDASYFVYKCFSRCTLIVSLSTCGGEGEPFNKLPIRSQADEDDGGRAIQIANGLSDIMVCVT